MLLRPRHSVTCAVAIACLAAVLSAATSAQVRAQQVEGADKQPQPVYNPATKSYFQRRTDMPDLEGHGWLKAKKKAASLTYKGVRGRLAVVRTWRPIRSCAPTSISTA
jgi:hypothetical protein